MPSSFFELSVASTGLFTAKGAINVVNHNINNAATPGFSRQVANVRARNPLNYYNGRGMIGTGSEVYGVGQIRNFYLDTKYWSNRGILGEYSAKNTQNQMLLATLNENDDVGFNELINEVFGVINRDLVPDSSSMAARMALINEAQTMAQYFNASYSALQKQQSDINMEISGVVSTVNNLGLQIQNLNKQIYVSEMGGQQNNDLRDSRALLVDELSKYVNTEVREVELNKNLLTGESEKHYQVMINGYDFVDHYTLNTLTCIERTTQTNFEDSKGLYDIYWNNGVKFNSEFSLATMSGELKGLLVTRDGNNQNYPTAAVSSVSDGLNGSKIITFDATTANRLDWPDSGNITLDGAIYSYSGFIYDKATETIKVQVPPQDSTLTVGASVVKYNDLTVSGSTVTFDVYASLTLNELRNKIKIGDMTLSGSVSISPEPPAAPNPDGSRTVTITGCTAANNISGLSTASVGGKTAKVGQSVDYKGIPYFLSKLNTFVRGISMAFNQGTDVHGNKLEGITGHYNAYNLNKYVDDSYENTGYNFFTYTGQYAAYGIQDIKYHLMTAGNFTVAKELLDDPHALACALSQNPDISDSLAIQELLSLKHNGNVFDEGEFGNFIESIIGELGIVTMQAETFESNYTDITTSVDYQRLSVSSVNLDEEMTSLLYWQQIYNACAKMISTLNGIYDTTINKLGV